MDEWDQYHQSVLEKEVIEYLNPKAGDIFVDGTLGAGGHAQGILNKIGESGKLIAIDQDRRALAIAEKRLKVYRSNCSFIHDNFRNIDKILEGLSVERVNGILLDVGISSMQLADDSRGFSFKTDAALDMRMDQSQELNAYEIVNTYSEEKLSEILREFGEERFHRRIAKRIVYERVQAPIETTGRLAEIVCKGCPTNRTRTRIHPATRTFQALRIVVNDELGSLTDAIGKSVSNLNAGGRVGIISFHSLEDRIVKQSFKELSNKGTIKLIVKKPIRPSIEEIKENPRARSAKFRVAERI